jgi:hypothetical protein
MTERAPIHPNLAVSANDLAPVARDQERACPYRPACDRWPLSEMHPDEKINDALDQLGYLTVRFGDHVTALRRLINLPEDDDDDDLPALWHRFEEAKAKVDASEDELAAADPVIQRYHEAREAIWSARLRDLPGLAVQLKMFRLLVETDEPSESQLATLDHVAAQIEAMAGSLPKIRSALLAVFEHTGGDPANEENEPGLLPAMRELEAKARVALRLLDQAAPPASEATPWPESPWLP